MVISRQERLETIREVHECWLGRLTAFRLDVLQAVKQRHESGILHQKLWLQTPPPQAEKPSTASASSSQQPSEKTPLPWPLADEEGSEGAPAADSEMFPKIPHVEGSKPSSDADLVKDGTEYDEEARWAERMSEMIECMGKLNDIDWLDQTPDKPEYSAALEWIFEHGLMYCDTFMNGTLQPWAVDGYPPYIRPWFSEMERVFRALARRGWLPHWLRHPRDKWIREDAGESATGFVDPGNFTLDLFVHVMRLWRYIDVIGMDPAIRQPQREYGHQTNKSSRGPVNLRGNIVEASARDLQKMGSSVIQHWQRYNAVDWWSNQWYEKDPRPAQPEEEADDDWWQWAATASSSR